MHVALWNKMEICEAVDRVGMDGQTVRSEGGETEGGSGKRATPFPWVNLSVTFVVLRAVLLHAARGREGPQQEAGRETRKVVGMHGATPSPGDSHNWQTGTLGCKSRRVFWSTRSRCGAVPGQGCQWGFRGLASGVQHV